MMIRCLIVDDEEPARALLQNYVGRLSHLELAGACKNPLDALEIMRSGAVDLLFLDIQMPEISGMDLLKSMPQKPLTVFTTAYPDYALEGYTVDAVDYLLKPFAFERFVQAVNKAAERMSSRQVAEVKDYILVKSEHRVFRLKFNDILYVEGMREYVAFHTQSTGRILSLTSLKQVEENLPSDRFVRVHKSWIAAVDRIIALEGNQIVIGKIKLPVGATYKEAVMKIF